MAGLKPNSARTRTISGKIPHGLLVRMDRAVDRLGWKSRTDAINAAMEMWLATVEAEFAAGQQGDD